MRVPAFFLVCLVVLAAAVPAGAQSITVEMMCVMVDTDVAGEYRLTEGGTASAAHVRFMKGLGDLVRSKKVEVLGSASVKTASGKEAAWDNLKACSFLWRDDVGAWRVRAGGLPPDAGPLRVGSALTATPVLNADGTVTVRYSVAFAWGKERRVLESAGEVDAVGYPVLGSVDISSSAGSKQVSRRSFLRRVPRFPAEGKAQSAS